METKLNEWRHAFIINVKRKVTISAYKVDTQMEHDQSSYFCRGRDDFCWGPAPVGPTLVTEPIIIINISMNYVSTGVQRTWERIIKASLVHVDGR